MKIGTLFFFFFSIFKIFSSCRSPNKWWISGKVDENNLRRGPEKAKYTNRHDFVEFICSAVWPRLDEHDLSVCTLSLTLPVSWKLRVFENGCLVLISYSMYENRNLSPKWLNRLQVVRAINKTTFQVTAISIWKLTMYLDQHKTI